MMKENRAHGYTRFGDKKRPSRRHDLGPIRDCSDDFYGTVLHDYLNHLSLLNTSIIAAGLH
jgi:hypothetical protein